MNKLKRLLKSYAQYIAIPWRSDAAAAQRVVFCVYDETDELQMRAKIDEFELTSRQAGHEWACFDLTNAFPEWMQAEEYAASYYAEPELLNDLLPDDLLDFIERIFDIWAAKVPLTENTVVALMGFGSLFGFVKVKDCIDRLAPRIEGRLVVFFPGSYENNNYRLLDGYDGWNYLAAPITADRSF
ncbi:MAG: DUF1788 domain-containing protein [Desulfuromonadales bacterium]|nr:DUF1788 domain-containing protein [Desulfuromonadales bacterium]